MNDPDEQDEIEVSVDPQTFESISADSALYAKASEDPAAQAKPDRNAEMRNEAIAMIALVSG